MKNQSTRSTLLFKHFIEWPSLGVTTVLSLGASGGQEAVNGQQTWHYSGYASSQAKYKLAVLSWEDRSFSSNPCVET